MEGSDSQEKVLLRGILTWILQEVSERHLLSLFFGSCPRTMLARKSPKKWERQTVPMIDQAWLCRRKNVARLWLSFCLKLMKKFFLTRRADLRDLKTNRGTEPNKHKRSPNKSKATVGKEPFFLSYKNQRSPTSETDFSAKSLSTCSNNKWLMFYQSNQTDVQLQTSISQH